MIFSEYETTFAAFELENFDKSVKNILNLPKY